MSIDAFRNQVLNDARVEFNLLPVIKKRSFLAIGRQRRGRFQEPFMHETVRSLLSDPAVLLFRKQVEIGEAINLEKAVGWASANSHDAAHLGSDTFFRPFSAENGMSDPNCPPPQCSNETLTQWVTPPSSAIECKRRRSLYQAPSNSFF